MTSTAATPPASSQIHLSDPRNKTGPQRHIPPQEVAWMFVQEYYTFVNKNPGQLHKFYKSNSSFVHGTEGVKVDACYGDYDINRKIVDIDFQDCKVCISNVDSLASMAGGIIVQVLGELSNKNGPSVKFAQTFFLAEQPGGYYVLSDIFRYLKDEIEYECEIESDNVEEPAAVATKVVDAPKEAEEIVSDQASIPSSPPSPIAAPPAPQHVAPEVSHPEEPKPSVERPASPVKTTPPPAEVVPEKSEAVKPAVVEPVRTPEVNGWGTKREASPARPAPSAPAAPQKHSATEGAKASQAGHQEKGPKTSGGKAPSASSGPATKQSWATLAASDSNKWTKDTLAEVKGSVAHVTTPSNVKSVHLPPSGQPPASAPAAQGVREHKEKPRQNDPNASIFVKGLHQAVTRDMLIASFSDCGEVINCDINHTRNTAFVDFVAVDSAQRAIKERSFTLVDGTIVHAEEKKFRGYNPRTHQGGRGGYSNRGNSNYNRGEGGMDTRGGRGGRGRSDMAGGKGRGGGSSSGSSGEKAGGSK